MFLTVLLIIILSFLSENLKVWKESKPSQKSSTEEGTDVISKLYGFSSY